MGRPKKEEKTEEKVVENLVSVPVLIFDIDFSGYVDGINLAQYKKNDEIVNPAQFQIDYLVKYNIAKLTTKKIKG